jgi:hypothetical protein
MPRTTIGLPVAKQPPRALVGFVAHQDGARAGRALELSCQVDGVANHRVFHVQIAAHLAGDDQAGVDADPHVEVEAAQRQPALAVLAQRLQHRLHF